MKSIFFIVFLCIGFPSLALAGWSLPEDPDPSEVFKEARQDTTNGKYQEALEKYLWFHHNVLKYDESYYGVRLSYALDGWYKLGIKYPPALSAMKEVRDQAEKKVKEGVDYYHYFHDYVSLNEQLNEHKRTLELFLWLEANRPEYAKNVYLLAQPSLIVAKKYTLCDKYLDSEKLSMRYIEDLKMQIRYAGECSYPEEIREFAYHNFSHEISTLVALLVQNSRYNEADMVADRALKVWNSDKLKAALSSALDGKVPEPY